jgi:hypothetical protein
MNMKMLAKLFALSGAAMALGATPSFAAGGVHCRDIGGGILTNFLDPSQCLPTSNSSVGLCTDGPAAGDLRGAVGVQVRAVNNNGSVLHNHHHWVTDSGDTITFEDADLTLLANVNGQYLGNYLNGVKISGGTGAFEGATGNLDSVFGAIDFNKGQITLRYAGTVCFPTVKEP